MKRKHLLPSLALGALLSACGKAPEAPAASNTISHSLPLMTASAGAPLEYTAVGSVVSDQRVEVASRLSGYIRDILVQEGDHEAAVRRTVELTGATVLLKGAETLVASPGGTLLRVRNATPWLATAGAGDALAGILGALLATHAAADDLAPVAAAAAWIHGEAARRASEGGPFVILDLCAAIPGVVRQLATMSA